MASHLQPPVPRVRRLTSRLDVYLVLVALAGLAVATPLLPSAVADLRDVGVGFWVLAACALPAEVIRIPVWRGGAMNQITMSRPFVLALLIGWGAPLTVLVFVAASVVSDLFHRKPAPRVAFNAGQYALSISAGGAIYLALGGDRTFTLGSVPAFVAAALALMLVNRLLVRVAVALYEQQSLTVAYLLSEAQVELVEGTVQFSMVLAALLVAEHSPILPVMLALPVLPIYLAGHAADQTEALSRKYAKETLHYRHLFVVTDRFRRRAETGSAVNSLQLAAMALELRTSTSMLKGLLATISREAARRDLEVLQALASNGVEHAEQLAGKLDQLQSTAAAQRSESERQHIDAAELVNVAEQLAKIVCAGRPVVAVAPSGSLPVYVNQDEVLDVLGNLVLNAHRFAPAQTPIHLVAGREADCVVLAVEDDGVNVPPERRERVFDQGLELGGGLHAGGSLAHGVAVARQLAHANGGELRSVGPDDAGRVRYELVLPLARTNEPGGRLVILSPERLGPRGRRGGLARGRRPHGDDGDDGRPRRDGVRP